MNSCRCVGDAEGNAVRKVPSLSMQRRIIENADERLRQSKKDGRIESGCVVCARRFWKEDLKLLILFKDPENVDASRESSIEEIASGQQHRLRRLLGVERYRTRWPHIDEQELRESAVEHPYCAGQYLLLHKRRMPMDPTEACLVCKECKGSLTSSTLTLPRHSLANDLWLGKQPAALRNLAPSTKRLLPLTRACLQVVVLQPANLQPEERQHGLVGNSIFLPQARPSAILSTLPPKDVDMQDAVLFVLVGGRKEEVRSSKLLKAPRDEYAAAVQWLMENNPFYAQVELEAGGEDVLDGCVLETDENSALAQELLQKGPADAQGQGDEEDEKKPAETLTAEQEERGNADERMDDPGTTGVMMFAVFLFLLSCYVRKRIYSRQVMSRHANWI